VPTSVILLKYKSKSSTSKCVSFYNPRDTGSIPSALNLFEKRFNSNWCTEDSFSKKDLIAEEQPTVS
jgi:hypothetical protein